MSAPAEAARTSPRSAGGSQAATHAGEAPASAPWSLLLPETRWRARAADCAAIELRRTADETVVLSVGGRLLCSASDPRGEGARWAAGQTAGSHDLLVVFGLAGAHHLVALRERCSGPLLVVEPDPAVLAAVLRADALPPLAAMELTDDPERARSWLTARLTPGHRARLLAWPATLRRHPGLFAATRDALARATSLAEVTATTVQRRAKVWIEHIVQNALQAIDCVPATCLDGWLAGRPAFIVSAGPSLAKNAAELARVAERGVIIAVNTALGALERAGVRADLVVALEARDVSEQLDGLELNAATPRVVALSAHPALLRTARGPVLPFIERLETYGPLAARLQLLPTVPSGGSVANSAFALARLLGARRIVLVGQDLAYGDDGRVYAPGTIFEQMSVTVDETGRARFEGLAAKERIAATRPEVGEDHVGRVQRVEAWGGVGHVRTTLAFSYFRDVFERWAAQEDEVELINATEGGARLHGFAERRLAEVVAELATTGAGPAGPWPTAPRLTAERVVATLEAERRKISVVGELGRRLVAGDETGETLSALAAGMHECALLHGYCWPELARLIDEDQATSQELGQQVRAAAEQLEALLERALATAPTPAAAG